MDNREREYDKNWWYKKMGVKPPTSEPHGTEDDIKSNLVPLKPKEWRLEGNLLIAETEHGTHAQTIPTNYILTGTDDDGLPIFKKVVLS